MSKSPLKSWTLWFSAALVVASAVLEQLEIILPETAGLGIASGIVTALLRVKTTEPVV